MPETRLVLLLIGTGWGVRTFLQTRVLDRLRDAGEVAILAAPELATALRHRLSAEVRIEPLAPFDPDSGGYGRAYRRRNRHFLRLASTETRRFVDEQHRRTLHGRWRRQLRHHGLRVDAALSASPRSLTRLQADGERHLLAEEPSVPGYDRLLDELAPAVVVSTAPHHPNEAPPAIVARSRGIPTAAWVSSWDNLTSKPAYYTSYDRYLVWSARMAEELRRYYPESRDRGVSATGVPHFDWYRDPSMRWSREELGRRVGLDARRPLLLYAAATPHLSPAEHLVIQRLAADLQSRPEPRPQLLVRLHPGDAGGRLRDWTPPPGVALRVPGAAGLGRLDRFCPDDDDNRELVSSIWHADVVINLASTVTLEACVCDRPVVNVAYDLHPGEPLRRAIERYYRFEHYRTVLEAAAVRVARSHEELHSQIDTYLADPSLDREGRARLARLWCGDVDGQAGERLGRALVEAAAAGAEPT